MDKATFPISTVPLLLCAFMVLFFKDQVVGPVLETTILFSQPVGCGLGKGLFYFGKFHVRAQPPALTVFQK